MLHTRLESKEAEDRGLARRGESWFLLLPEHERDERDGDNEQVEQVEAGAAKGARVKDEAVGYHLQAHLNREDRGEEVIEIVEDLQEGRRSCVLGAV